MAEEQLANVTYNSTCKDCADKIISLCHVLVIDTSLFLLWKLYPKNTGDTDVMDEMDPKETINQRVRRLFLMCALYNFLMMAFTELASNTPITLFLAMDHCVGGFAFYHLLSIGSCLCGGEENILAELYKKGESVYSVGFHRILKLSARQFGITKIACGTFLVVVVTIERMVLHHDAIWSLENVYGYILIILTFSTFFAAWALFTFVSIVRDHIKPESDRLVLFVMTAVVLLYSQGTALAGLEYIGVIAPALNRSGVAVPGKEALYLQGMCASMESIVVFVIIRTLYSDRELEETAPTSTVLLVSTVKHDSVVILKPCLAQLDEILPNTV